MAWGYRPSLWNGTALPNFSIFGPWYFLVGPNSPGGVQPGNTVLATIPGKGDQHVRFQPKSTVWRMRVQVTDTSEATLQTMLETFSPDLGLVYLTIADGDGLTWRVPVQVETVDIIHPALFDVVLRVPNPIMERSSLQTELHNNSSGASIAIAPSPGGNRRCRPKFTINADSVKTNIIDDYSQSLRGFFVNRGSPNILNNFPVQLFDDNGNAGTIDTVAIITDATRTNLINNGAGITATANVIAIDTPVGGGLPTSGMGYVDTEQIYWTGNNGSQLTGVVRGIGGTTAATHADNAVITNNKALRNGDDCRVWVNDKEVDRWLGDWNTTASRLWINADVPKAEVLTATAAVTAGSPANGGSLAFVEGVAHLPPVGFFVWNNEMFYYSGKSGRSVTGIQRGVHGTTAGIHVVATPIYTNPVRFVVGIGKATAGKGPAPIATRPAIALDGVANASFNGLWRWGVGDALSVFFDKDNPGRSAMFAPGFDKDGNDIAPLLQLSEGKTALTFKDDAPGDGSPPYNFATIEMPCGIQSADAAAVTMDWTPAAEILNLELFLRDKGGTVKLMDQLQQSAAAANRQLPAVTADVSYALKLKARYNIVTGFRGVDAHTHWTEINNASAAEGTAGWLALKFTLEQDTAISALMVKLQKSTAGSADVFGFVRPDSGGLPNMTALAMRTRVPSDAAGVASVLAVNNTPAFYKFNLPHRGVYRAGSYWFLIASNPSAGAVPVRVFDHNLGRQYPTLLATNPAGTFVLFQDRNPWLYVLSAYDNTGGAPIQGEQPMVDVNNSNVRTGVTASFNNLRVTPRFPVYVDRVAGFGQTLYHAVPTISCAESGDSFSVDKWMALASPLAIDCELRTAIYTEGNVAYSVPDVVTPADLSQWLELVPVLGNTVTYAEPNMTSTDVTTIWRDVRV